MVKLRRLFEGRNKFYALFLGLVVFLLLHLPVTFQKREIMPHGMHRGADFNIQQVVPISDQVTFQIAVSGGLQLLHRPIFLEDLTNVELINAIPKNKFTKPYIAIERIGFKLATYKMPLRCDTVQILLNSKIRSRPLSCRSILDNEISYFDFDEPIRPGIYQVHFSGEVKSPFAAYAYVSESKENWLPLHYQKERTRILNLLGNWLSFEPVKSIPYILSIFFLGLLFISGRPSRVKYFSLIITLSISFMLITPYYSGHDETAHLTMLKRSLLPEKDESNFNNEANASMIDNDFFRMHNARLLQEGECPHQILKAGNCGNTPKPEYLYRFYGKVLQGIGLEPQNNPDYLLNMGRISNFVLLLTCLALVGFIYGETGLLLLTFYCLFVGSFLGQVSSISNDPPMYLLGFTLAVAIVHSVLRPSKRNWLFLPILATSFFFAKSIDRSAVAALPGMLLLIIFVCTIRRYPGKSIAMNLRNVVFFVLTALGLLIGGLNWQPLTEAMGIDLVSIVRIITDDAAMMQNIKKFDLASALVSLRDYAYSGFGSFIWGHSDVPRAYQFLMAIFTICASALGIAHLNFKSKIKNAMISILLAVLWVSHLLVILSTQGASIGSPEVVFQSFLKTRLTAPGLGSFLIPISLAVFSYYKTDRLKTALFRVFCLWGIFWQAYLLPFVIFKELY